MRIVSNILLGAFLVGSPLVLQANAKHKPYPNANTPGPSPDGIILRVIEKQTVSIDELREEIEQLKREVIELRDSKIQFP